MPTERPNILLVTTDQQRYDASGGAGPAFLRTPHYDHLRREGVTFTRAYSDCALCVPARVSLMTGRFATTHGALGNVKTSTVMGREDTLPGRLRAAGYQTAAIGKMHFGPQRARHGFDEMTIPEDYYRMMVRSGHAQQPMHHGLGQNELHACMSTVPESMTLTSWIAEQCVEYIRERRDPTVPFFLWCSFSHPHPPLDPPEPYYSMYRNCAIPAPVYGDWSEGERCPAAFRRMREEHSYDLIPPEVIREARAAYYGLITQIDYNLGRVFSALQDKGLFNDTLILYTSDHGEFLGDHHAGSKVFFHEPSAHVPFVVRMPQSWPDRRHGTSCEALVTHADVLPTCLAVAGGSGQWSGVRGQESPPMAIDGSPSDLSDLSDRSDHRRVFDGQDLIALARGQVVARPFLHATAGRVPKRDFLAVIDGRWKYIYWPEGAVEQLFDLTTDPQERTDLGTRAEFADRRAALRDEAVRWHAERQTGFLVDGRLPARPLENDSSADRRNRSWPGYHTEFFDVDVRH